MTPEEKTKFVEFIDSDVTALVEAARALANKIRASEEEARFINDGLNLAFAAISDGFGAAVSMHGWVELIEEEKKLRVHTCSSILNRCKEKNFMRALRPVLYQLTEQIQKEPRKILLLAGANDEPS